MHADVRETIKYAQSLGFTLLDGLDGRGHYRLQHNGNGATLSIPCTPSEWRSMLNTRARLRRAAGESGPNGPNAGKHKAALPRSERPLSFADQQHRSESETQATERVAELITEHRRLTAELEDMAQVYRRAQYQQALRLTKKLADVEKALRKLHKPIPEREKTP